MLPVLEGTLFGVLVLGNFLLGMYFSFRKRALRIESTSAKLEMFLGSRTLKTLPLAVSSVASLFSSTGLVGFTAHYYAYGWHINWGFAVHFLCLPIATHLFIPVLYRLRITSIFEEAHGSAYPLPASLCWKHPAPQQRRPAVRINNSKYQAQKDMSFRAARHNNRQLLKVPKQQLQQGPRQKGTCMFRHLRHNHRQLPKLPKEQLQQEPRQQRTCMFTHPRHDHRQLLRLPKQQLQQEPRQQRTCTLTSKQP
ncbi:hypothetical protein MTO96_044899 [Rhipicephalus appendiculatus]